MASSTPKYSWLVLIMLMCCYVMNQWDRFLINYLFSVPVSGCPAGKGNICDGPGAYLTKELAGKALTYQLDAVCTHDDAASVNSTCTAKYGEWKQCAECTTCLIDFKDTKKFAMKFDTCIDSSEYGIAAGYGFVATFAFSSLVAGRCCDLFNRKLIIGAALMLWSLSIVAMGASNDFSAVMGSRLGLGLFQAFLIPPCYSLIQAYFPKDMLGTAYGIFNFGIYVGGGLSSISIILAKALGWRTTSYICAGIGAALSVAFVLVVREPSRGGVGGEDDDDGKQPSVQDVDAPPTLTTKEAFAVVFRDKAVVMLILAGGLRFFGGIGIGSFMPQFYQKKFNKQEEYALINAAVVSVGGALSSYFGGYLADRWSKRQVKARAWVPAIGCLLGLVPFIGTLYFTNFYVSLVCYFFEYLFAECWFGPAISIIQIRIPAGARGVAVSLFLFTAQMVGNAAPALYGSIWNNGTAPALQTLLLFGTAGSYIGSALLFLLIGTQLGDGSSGGCGGGEEPLLDSAGEDGAAEAQVALYGSDGLAKPSKV